MKAIRFLVAGALVLVLGSAQATLVDRGGGLIFDDVFNVTWLSDANYANTMGNQIGFTGGRTDWAHANSWALNLSYTDTVRGVIYDDWHLPTTVYSYPCTNGSCSEMQSLYQRLLGPAIQQGGDNVLATNHNSSYDLYQNIQPAFYWSSQNPQQTNDAWYVDMSNGHMNTLEKGAPYLYAWAVRDGDVAAAPIAAAPEPETYAMLLAGLGLMGFMAPRGSTGSASN